MRKLTPAQRIAAQRMYEKHVEEMSSPLKRDGCDLGKSKIVEPASRDNHMHTLISTCPNCNFRQDFEGTQGLCAACDYDCSTEICKSFLEAKGLSEGVADVPFIKQHITKPFFLN